MEAELRAIRKIIKTLEVMQPRSRVRVMDFIDHWIQDGTPVVGALDADDEDDDDLLGLTARACLIADGKLTG